MIVLLMAYVNNQCESSPRILALRYVKRTRQGIHGDLLHCVLDHLAGGKGKERMILRRERGTFLYQQHKMIMEGCYGPDNELYKA